MARFKLNKVELTRLRRRVKTYNQYLPVLKLKQEQLQGEQIKARRELAALEAELGGAREELDTLVPLLGEEVVVDLRTFLTPYRVEVEQRTVAGVEVPVVREVHFHRRTLSYFGNPAWLSRASDKIRDFIGFDLRVRSYRERLGRISAELRRTTQKVNLFEQVLVPEATEGIRRIRIALGDQQVAAVGRAKLAKGKALAAARGRAS